MDADQVADVADPGAGDTSGATGDVGADGPHGDAAAAPNGAARPAGSADEPAPPEPDASTPNAGTPDGTPDPGTPDGTADVGIADRGTPDGGTPDDSGSGVRPANGGTPDAPPDAGTPEGRSAEGPAPAPSPVLVSARDAIAAPVGAMGARDAATAAALAGDDQRRREEVPWLIIWSAIGVVLGAAAAIELILALKQVVELLVIASFLAVVLSPAVSALVRIKIRRGFATTIVFLLGMAAFGGLGYVFIHPLYREAIRFANDLPDTLARVQAGKGRIGSIIARYHLQKDAATYIPKIRDYLSHLGGPALSAARTVLSGLGGLVILSIMTFLLLLEGPSLVKGLLRVLPASPARRVRRILDDVAKSVTGYVIGNFATSVIAGVICGTALLILGVPFAIVFGVWVALVDLIPLVGGLLAGVPTVAFAFLYSPTAGIVTLIVFLVYQQLENHLLNPLIMSRTVKLNPLWVLLSVLAGAELAGFVGALLAIPAAGTIHVIARDIWDERRGRLKPTLTVGPDQTPIP